MDAKRLLVAAMAVAFLAIGLGAVETLAQRRRRLEAMPTEQRDRLLRAEHEFRALSPQEQQRIRDLHQQIEAAPDRDELLATMNRYCKWLGSQPPSRQKKLADKKVSINDRILAIKDSVKRHPAWDIHLDDVSRRALVAWLDRYATEHGPEGLSAGPRPGGPRMLPDPQRVAKLPPERQRLIFRALFLRRWQLGGPNLPPVSNAEMARLRAAISSDVRTRLEAKKPADQNGIIFDWLHEAASRELDEPLAEFFETLEPGEIDRLMSLPPSDMYKALANMYRDQMLGEGKPGEPPHRNDPQRRGQWRNHRPGAPWNSAGRRRPDAGDAGPPPPPPEK